MELTNENYHGIEARKEYMGYSQFKDFLSCEKQALARINGEIEEKSSPALLFGSYVDNYFSKEISMDEFVLQHPEMFTKQGTFKSDYKNIEKRVAFFEQIYDELRAAVHERADSGGLKRKLSLLEDYYSSGEWRKDYEADEAGLLPAGLKRGVLSQDGVYNLLAEWEADDH